MLQTLLKSDGELPDWWSTKLYSSAKSSLYKEFFPVKKWFNALEARITSSSVWNVKLRIKSSLISVSSSEVSDLAEDADAVLVSEEAGCGLEDFFFAAALLLAS